jgi:hypothetical protein
VWVHELWEWRKGGVIILSSVVFDVYMDGVWMDGVGWGGWVAYQLACYESSFCSPCLSCLPTWLFTFSDR